MPKGCEITFGVDKCFSVDGVTIKSADGSTIRARKRWINQEVQCTAKVKHVTQRSNYSLKTARRRQELPRHLDLRVWLSATITGLPEIPHPLGELLGRIHSGQDNHLYPATMKYKKDVSTTHVLRGFIYLFIYLLFYINYHYFILPMNFCPGQRVPPQRWEDFASHSLGLHWFQQVNKSRSGPT